jgi:hypothetical protein
MASRPDDHPSTMKSSRRAPVLIALSLMVLFSVAALDAVLQ